MRLILASGSSYRKVLLSRLGIPFEVIVPAFDERMDRHMKPEKVVRDNTLGKARVVAAANPDAVVIASDQVAYCDGELLGKPENYETACRQLKAMSGKRITFLTGLAVIDGGQERYEALPYYVQMRELDDDEIRHYLNAEQPFDCAGSFKSEGLGIALFERMEGDDPTALVGLPLIRLSQWLKPLKQQL